MEYMIVDGQLYHHGIKGQKWGIRRFQNKDGTRTPAGKKRYKEDIKQYKQDIKKIKSDIKQGKIDSKQGEQDIKQVKKEIKKTKELQLRDKYNEYGLDYDNKDHVQDVDDHGFRAARRIRERMDYEQMSHFKASTIEAGRSMTMMTLAGIGMTYLVTLPIHSEIAKRGLTDPAKLEEYLRKVADKI